MTENTKRTKPTSHRLGELLATQHNIVTRRQTLVCGITASGLRHRLRLDGPWRKLLPGVYATVTGPVNRDQLEMAALLFAGPKAVITGAAAVRRHHLTCAGLNEVDILLPVEVRVQSKGYVRVQHTRRMPTSIWATGKIRFAPLARAVGDAARTMRRFEDVQALVCEAVQKGNCALEDLIGELIAGPTTGSAFFRAALAELGEGIRSDAERELKYRIDRSDLEKPLYNARLYLADGTFLGIADAWWRRAGVACEVDSRQYHMNAKDHAATTARHNRMEAAGIHVLHFLPKDVKPKWPAILADLRNAIACGTMNPPLPIITVPADVTDIDAYLRARLDSRVAA